MLTLYALKQSRAYRIVWLLELLELDYKLEIVERDKHTFLAPHSLRNIHPLGKSPLIQDGELALGESGAIVEYLLNKYDPENRFRITADQANYPNYLYWLHYAEGSIMPFLIISLLLRRIDERKMPFFIKPITRKITNGVRESFVTPQLKLHLDYIEQHLAEKQWFLGEQLSGADIMMSFPLQVLTARGLGGYPNIHAYTQRIGQTASFKRAEEKLGTFKL